MAINAKESKSVVKARKKIEKQIENERKQMTPQALQEVANNIHQWINRHQQERINLKTKTFALFDANHFSAAPKSKFVHHLLSKLKNPSLKSKKITFKGSIVPTGNAE